LVRKMGAMKEDYHEWTATKDVPGRNDLKENGKHKTNKNPQKGKPRTWSIALAKGRKGKVTSVSVEAVNTPRKRLRRKKTE